MAIQLFRSQPDLDWIQVSISTHCNASCVYCPSTVHRDKWRAQHMDPELFSRFISKLKNVDLIYLQGWGEPFLHPNFWQMLSQVKKKGFLAGCTSNANLLDADKLKKAVELGLDVLSLSLAGVDERNDRIREGTSFRQVVKVIEELQGIKARQRSATPSLHLSYMLLRQGLKDLKQLPELVMGLGVEHVVISSLTLPLSPDLEREALLADSPEEYRDLQGEMRAIFETLSLQDKVFFHLYNPFKTPGNCAENVQKALCLSAEGRVTPCVFTQVPVQKPAAYYYQGREYNLQQADFGQVQDQNLKAIWHNKEYKAFRKNLDLMMCARCTKTRIDSTLQESF